MHLKWTGDARFRDARSLMDVIRDYFEEHKSRRTTIAKEYFANGYSEIKSWSVGEHKGGETPAGTIHWKLVGSTRFKDVLIERYILHHSGQLEIPLLHFHKDTSAKRDVLLWFQEDGKAKPEVGRRSRNI